MLSKKEQLIVFLFIFGLLLLAVLLPLTPVLKAERGFENFPDRRQPTRVLPATFMEQENNRDDKPLGAYIELMSPEHPGQWSVVQWQDSAGDWHDVDGWRGELDSRGGCRWWVGAKDFGRGPFRWVVWSRALPTAVASDPFYLPTSAESTLLINLQTR